MKTNTIPTTVNLRALGAALLTIALLLPGLKTQAADGTWTNLVGGSWTDTTSWLGGTVPGAAGETADFSTLGLSADTTVTLDGARTVGNLIFADTAAISNWFLETGSGGPLTLSGTSPTVNVTNRTATLNVVVTGTEGFTKAGEGILVLGYTNTYTGGTLIQAGTVAVSSRLGINVASTNTLGDATTGTNDTVLELRATPASAEQTLLSAPLRVSSNAPSSKATLRYANTTSVAAGYTGTITLEKDLYIDSRGIFAPNGIISGTGDVHLVSSQSSGKIIRLNVNNTFVGKLYVDSCIAQIKTAAGSANVVPFGTDVIIGNTGTLRLVGSESINRLQGTGTVTPFNVASNPQITVGENNGSATYSGTMKDTDATHILNFAKNGTGTQTLDGNCTFTGDTSVNGGSLIINSNYASAIAVASGGTLGGSGFLSNSATIKSGGTLSPGSGIGELTISNSLNIAGNLLIELNKSLSPARSNDFVTVLGTLTNSGTGTLTVSNLGPALVAGDTFQLFSQAMVGGSTLNVTGGGAGVTWTNKLELDGSIQVLTASPGVNPTPTNIVSSVVGNQLTLSWPSDHTGWTLQSQTNVLSTGLTGTWYPVAGSTTTNQMSFTIAPANPTVFYRLMYLIP